MAIAAAGASFALNMDLVDVSLLATSPISTSNANTIVYSLDSTTHIDVAGAMTADSGGRIAGGTVTSISETFGGAPAFSITGLSLSGATLAGWVSAFNNAAAQAGIFSGDDTITGSNLGDLLRGYAGNDRITGGGGNDYIDGGTGNNIAVFSGSVFNYTATPNADGAWTVKDNRSGSPDGTDTLKNIQAIQFSDTAMNLSNPVPASLASLQTAFFSMLRIDPTAPDALAATILLADGSSVTNPTLGQSLQLITLAGQVSSGQTSLTAALTTVGHFADTATAVATLSYQFFTGKTPSSPGYDYLVHSPSNPNDLMDPYYAKFNIENRYINFAVNLGKLGAGANAFNAGYGALTLDASTTKAYTEIFGQAPAAGQVSTILNTVLSVNGQSMTRAQYFAVYGTDGLTGIGTKAAMVGFLMVEAVKADLGPYALANDRFMADLSDGAALYNVDLKTAYAGTVQTLPLIGVGDPVTDV